MKITVDLIGPDASSSEDAWNIAAENSSVEEEKERILRTFPHH